MWRVRIKKPQTTRDKIGMYTVQRDSIYSATLVLRWVASFVNTMWAGFFMIILWKQTYVKTSTSMKTICIQRRVGRRLVSYAVWYDVWRALKDDWCPADTQQTTEQSLDLQKYLTTVLRWYHDTADIAIDLRGTCNLQNILRRTQDFPGIRFTRRIVRSFETVFVN